MSPIIQTLNIMKSQTKRGGPRPNSGPKPNIEANIILYNIALCLDVGLDRVRHMLCEGDSPERLIGKEKSRTLRKLAASKDAHAALAIERDMYTKRRKELGFKP